MSDVQTIAKLVANLGFTVDDKQLDTFVKKIHEATNALKTMRDEAKNKLSFHVAINKSDLIQSKKTIASIGDVKVRLKDIESSPAKLANTRQKIADEVGKAKVRLTDISLSEASVRKIRQDIKDSIKVGGVTVPAKIDTREIDKQLREWIKTRQKQFTFRLGVSINQHNLYTNLKAAVDAAADKVKTIKLKDPNVRVGIDKQHLKTEIRDALAQIKRDVKIKIDLTGRADVSGQPSGGGGRAGAGGFGSRHSAIAGGVAGMAASWGRGFIPGLGGAFAVSQLNQKVQEFEAQQAAATAVTGSSELGGATLERLRALGNEVGFDYRSQAMPLLRMISSGTNAGMEQGEVETIFGNMAKYGRVMGLDDEAMKGSMRAVEQMLNKQQVYSEELKTQLAERMPGVISAMAEAVTGDANKTAELFKKMENGEVKSTEVMLKFSQILEQRAMAGGALQRAMQSTAAEQARFNNSWNDWVKKFGEGGFSKAMADFFGTAADTMEALNKNAGWAAKAFRVLLTPVTALLRLIEKANEYIPKFAESIGMSSGELQTMGAIVLGLIFPWTRFLTILGVVITALDDIVAFAEGRDSLLGQWLDSIDDSKTAKLKALGESFKVAGEEISKAFEGIGKALGDLGITWESISDSVFDAIVNKIQTVLAYVTAAARTISALREGDYSAAAGHAGDIAALAVSGTPIEYLLKPELKDSINGRVASLKGEGADRALENTANNWMQLPPVDSFTNPTNVSMGGVTINVNGIEAPNEVAVEIERHLDKIFNQAAFQVPRKL